MTIRFFIYSIDVSLHDAEFAPRAVHHHEEPSGLGLALHYEHGGL